MENIFIQGKFKKYKFKKIKSLLTETSLTQIYFWLSKVTDPNLKSSGLSPRLVSLNTSLKLKGNA
jgi:hypothetical protein